MTQDPMALSRMFFGAIPFAQQIQEDKIMKELLPGLLEASKKGGDAAQQYVLNLAKKNPRGVIKAAKLVNELHKLTGAKETPEQLFGDINKIDKALAETTKGKEGLPVPVVTGSHRKTLEARREQLKAKYKEGAGLDIKGLAATSNIFDRTPAGQAIIAKREDYVSPKWDEGLADVVTEETAPSITKPTKRKEAVYKGVKYKLDQTIVRRGVKYKVVDFDENGKPLLKRV